MATNQNPDNPTPGAAPDPTLVYDRNKPWWENPAPAGWTGPWPPPLEEGDTYGPEVGQVNYTPEHAQARYGILTKPTSNPNPTNGPTGGPGPGGPTAFNERWSRPFVPPTPGPGLPDTPQFHFTAPTYDEAVSEPGYDFARREGERGLQQSAAARGLLNSGGTLRDIYSWGNNFAATHYGDVYGRKYQLAQDEFSPQMTAYTTRAAANQRNNELAFTNAWNGYEFDYNAFRNWQIDNFDRYYRTATA